MAASQVMRLLAALAWLTTELCQTQAGMATSTLVALQFPTVVLSHVEFDIDMQLMPLKNGSVYPAFLHYDIRDSADLSLANGIVSTLDPDGNSQSELEFTIQHLKLTRVGEHKITAIVHEVNKQETRTPMTNDTAPVTPPGVDDGFRVSVTQEVYVSVGWICLLPPLVTLVLSALVGQVMISLLCGIWCGATIIARGNIITGFIHTFDMYWLNSFLEYDHAGVLLFTLLLGGTIGVVQKGGGGHGLALLAKKSMNTPFRMQLATFLLCLMIFFDDYSCILILGSSLRPVLGQTGVSREKFAAIIHTIGVCLASMSPVSSWIGVEIGYVGAQLKHLDLDWDPFLTCLSCLQYRFFPILFIGMIFMTIICEKDFGPMVQYEKDAAVSPILSRLDQVGSPPVASHGSFGQSPPLSPEVEEAMALASPVSPLNLGPMEPDPRKPMRWPNAVVPFVAIVVFTFVGMILDGFWHLEPPYSQYGLMDALSHCDSIAALIRASAAGWLIAVVMLLMQRIVTLDEVSKAWMEGVKDVMDPTLVLILAWALGRVINELNVPNYLASSVGEDVKPELLPFITTLLCYVVSFATGSGAGTMAIMFPIMAPLAFKISHGDTNMLMICFGCILGGSTFGNCCSPIADTSILASMAAHVSLEDHIRSMLPYSLLVAFVALVGGALPLGFKFLKLFTCFGMCFAVLLLLVFFCGTKVHSRFRALSTCSFLSSNSSSLQYSMSERERMDRDHVGSSHEMLPLIIETSHEHKSE